MKRIILGMFFIFLISGCATTSRFKGKGDLCGIIVDENNRPVENFLITCSLNGIEKLSVLTNERGIFVFNDMLPGKYCINGQKESYGKIDNELFDFAARDKLFCCKVNSVESVLSSIDKQILSENFSVAEELLENICVKKDSPEEETVIFYKAYLNYKTGDYNKSFSEIKKLKKKAGKKYESEIGYMEELLNEKSE